MNDGGCFRISDARQGEAWAREEARNLPEPAWRAWQTDSRPSPSLRKAASEKSRPSELLRPTLSPRSPCPNAPGNCAAGREFRRARGGVLEHDSRRHPRTTGSQNGGQPVTARDIGWTHGASRGFSDFVARRPLRRRWPLLAPASPPSSKEILAGARGDGASTSNERRQRQRYPARPSRGVDRPATQLPRSLSVTLPTTGCAPRLRPSGAGRRPAWVARRTAIGGSDRGFQ